VIVGKIIFLSIFNKITKILVNLVESWLISPDLGLSCVIEEYVSVANRERGKTKGVDTHSGGDAVIHPKCYRFRQFLDNKTPMLPTLIELDSVKDEVPTSQPTS
jgi:hypothetical protein